MSEFRELWKHSNNPSPIMHWKCQSLHSVEYGRYYYKEEQFVTCDNETSDNDAQFLSSTTTSIAWSRGSSNSADTAWLEMCQCESPQQDRIKHTPYTVISTWKRVNKMRGITLTATRQNKADYTMSRHTQNNKLSTCRDKKTKRWIWWFQYTNT